jgi:hypothetical protein
MKTTTYWKQVREVCDKATPGNAVEAGFDHDSDLHEFAIEYPDETPIIGGFYREVDRTFYLTARTALPAALDDIEDLRAGQQNDDRDYRRLTAEIERLRTALADTYGIVKRAFITIGEDGRPMSDVNPSAQARIKGALREHVGAALGDDCVPGCLCSKCRAALGKP